MAKGRFVSYLRVSTDRQGRSGLGLEAQRKAVSDYLDGGDWELIEEYIEVESGKKNSRPELAMALDACKKHKATLVIAKLDRLAQLNRLFGTHRTYQMVWSMVDSDPKRTKRGARIATIRRA